MFEAIDKLLERYFQKSPDYNRLSEIESDVWRQIRQNKVAAKSISVVLPIWSNYNIRYASLTLAFMSGLIMSQASLQPSNKSNTLGLEVFSPNVSFMITSNSKKLDFVTL